MDNFLEFDFPELLLLALLPLIFYVVAQYADRPPKSIHAMEGWFGSIFSLKIFLIVVLLGIFLSGVGAFLAWMVNGYLPSFYISNPKRNNLSVIIPAFFVLCLAYGVKSLFINSSETLQRKIESINEELESTEQNNLSFFDYLRQQVRRTRLREDYAAKKAEYRADLMYRLGAWLMALSVACPIVGALLYWTIDPLPQSVVDRLVELDGKLKVMPATIEIVAHRDWRLLFGGVSMGFLFLASSAGILRQKTREVAIMDKADAKVSYYERLESLLELESKDKSEQEKRLLSFVQHHLLLDRSGIEAIPKSDNEREESQNGVVSSLLKMVNDAK